MRARLQGALWFLVATLICLVLFPYFVAWAEGQITASRARDLGVPPPLYFPRVFGLTLLGCFLTATLAAWVARVRFSAGVLLAITGAALACAVSAEISSVIVIPGKHLNERFLDGFAERVTASSIERETIEWADSILADASLKPGSDGEVDLPPEKIPGFITRLFGEDEGWMKLTVDFEKGNDRPVSISVYKSYGVYWGLWIPTDPNYVPDWHEWKPRRCGERLFVFIYYYK